MEEELRANLITCGQVFVAAATARGEKLSLSTLGRQIGHDGGFFDRIADPSTTFTMRTYDRAMSWMSDRWPDGAKWPRKIARPEPRGVAA